MGKMTIDDLRGILVACAGDAAEGTDGTIADTSFEELGYDSLVLIETAATLKRDYGVDVPDDQLAQARTPSDLLGLINDRIEV